MSSVRFAVFSILASNILFASPAHAVTSGPTQPDFRAWAPTDNRELVDLFTGDFQYSIPLLEIPGPNGSFPLTLSYRSGISVEQEGSWVGLGWTLSAGSITRQLRGLPDDFGGGNDQITNTYRALPTATVGVGAGIDFKLYGAKALGATVGIDRYYNTDRGFGWAATLGIKGQYAFSASQQRSLSGGLSVTYDTQQGASANVSGSLSLSDRFNAGMAADISALEGLQSFALTTGFNKPPVSGYNRETMRWQEERGTSAQQTYGVNFAGYASPGHVPDTPYDTEGVNIDFSVAVGPEVQGAFPNMRFSGFASGQKIKRRTVSASAYGYLYSHQAGADDLLDFYREKEGPVWDKSPVLPTPILTNDLYNISGGKISGVFRGYRNDIPFLWDKRHYTTAEGYTVGLDLGIGTIVRVGIGGTRSRVRGEIGPWDDYNIVRDRVTAATSFEPNAERTYFQFIGESTANHRLFEGRLGDEAPLRVALSEEWTFNPGSSSISLDAPPDLDGLIPYRTAQANSELWRSPGNSISIPAPDDSSLATGSHPLSGFVDSQRFRNPRSAVIRALTNEQLAQFRGALEGLIDYSSISGSRLLDHPKHIGAFIVTEPDGTRYVYGLAVYNLTQKEITYNVNASASKLESDLGGNVCLVAAAGYDALLIDSDEYLHVKSVTPYPHTYLLTAILGPDYSDIDVIPGPSDADLGYWVKFTYAKEPTYMWRAPFTGANFIKGMEKPRDDKGTFTVGTKELWYLKRIETRTHFATFGAETNREDARGATSERQDSASLGARLKRLDSIALHAKSPGGDRLLKTVLFTYDYSLTPRTVNSSAPGGGKLTLKSVAIDEGHSRRGQLNPYTFTYSANNPGYDSHAQDWWGASINQKDCSGYPYTSKHPTGAATNAAAWTLTGVTEPNGGKVAVEYEKDRYAFVQDRPATRLYRFRSLDAKDSAARRIYIEPEVVPEGGNDAARSNTFAKAYIGPDVAGQQVYFRIRSLIKPSAGYYASIGGYAKVAGAGYCSTCPNGLSGLGWIELANVDGKHPFEIASKEYLRLQEPDKLYDETSSLSIDPHKSPLDFLMAGLTLAKDFALNAAGKPVVDQAIDLIYSSLGETIQAADSWIRLRVPGDKVGGDSRVRSITVNDAWCESTGTTSECTGPQQATSETSATYGWLYEYLTEDGYSSGVAANEPGVGGEENPLREAESFVDDHWFRTDHNLFYEKPMNMGYFPAPSVGYRRVVKTNLEARAARLRLQAAENKDLIPRPSLAGPTVHEFFTAKEFPTRTDRTPAQRKGDFAPIPIPLVGMITLQTKSWSQGQSVVTNDMHGKPRRTASYGLSTELEPVMDAPLRSEEYRYQDTVPVIDSTASLDIQALHSDNRKLGRSEEMFLDMRKHRTTAQSIGIDSGVDTIIAVLPIPIPIPWLSLSYSVQEVKLAVVNKVVHKSHVLVHTEGQDRGTVFRRENRYFDAITGRPVIQTDDNNFGDPVYDFSIPAYWMYPSLGSTYRAADQFSATLSMSDATRREVGLARSAVPFYTLRGIALGTELIATNNSSTDQWSDRLLVVRMDDQKLWLRTRYVVPPGCTACPGSAPAASMQLAVLRGSRNALEAEAGKITALKDPLAYETQYCLIPREGECKTVVGAATKYPALVIPPAQLSHAINSALANVVPRKAATSSKSSRLRGEVAGSVLNIETQSKEAASCSVSFRNTKGQAIQPQEVRRVKGITAANRAPSAMRSPRAEYRALLELSSSKRSVASFLQTDCTSRAYVIPVQAELQKCTNYVAESYAVLEKVINAGATDFQQPAMFTDVNDIRTSDPGSRSLLELQQANPFELGLAGWWRPARRISYFEQRSASSPPNLKRDGTFDGVVMYDWGLSPSDSCVDRSKWRNMMEVTRYSPYGHELEERNPIGVYSTALFGFLSTVPVATARNARNDEIGFEGFEEFFGGVDEVAFKSGNIQFFDKIDDEGGKRFTIHLFDAELMRNMIRLRSSVGETSDANARANARAAASRSRHGGRAAAATRSGTQSPAARYAALRSSAGYSAGGRTSFIAGANCPSEIVNPLGPIFDVSKLSFDARTGSFAMGDGLGAGGRLFGGATFGGGGPDDGPARPSFESWRECFGKVVVDIPGVRVLPRGPQPYVAVTTRKAHTGKRSLKVEKVTRFEQDALALVPGKKYVLTVWVSRESTDADSIVTRSGAGTSYHPDLRVIDKVANTELGAGSITLGPVIEGWQKIEREFVAETDRIVLEFANDAAVSASPQVAFYDDVRIQPADSQMQSYVYDPETRRLSAILDQNHFATFFHFDGAGDLYLIDRETVDGIYSVQEARSHLRERR